MKEWNRDIIYIIGLSIFLIVLSIFLNLNYEEFIFKMCSTYVFSVFFMREIIKSQNPTSFLEWLMSIVLSVIIFLIIEYLMGNDVYLLCIVIFLFLLLSYMLHIYHIENNFKIDNK